MLENSAFQIYSIQYISLRKGLKQNARYSRKLIDALGYVYEKKTIGTFRLNLVFEHFYKKDNHYHGIVELDGRG